MKKQSKIVLISIFITSILILFIFRGNNNEYKVFANPHQIGEDEFYREQDILFQFDLPVTNIEQAKISIRLSETVNFNRFSKESLGSFIERKIFVVNHQNENDDTLHHIQVQEFYDGGGFMIFSAYELDNPYFNLDKIDVYDSKVNIHEVEDREIVELLNTTNLILTQQYYTYNSNNESINLAATGGNELYSYEDGVFYHLMYSDNKSRDKALKLFEEFIIK